MLKGREFIKVVHYGMVCPLLFKVLVVLVVQLCMVKEVVQVLEEEAVMLLSCYLCGAGGNGLVLIFPVSLGA